MKVSSARPQTCCPIVELRQYTLHPGKRHVLIELFDREFIEPQEAAGMKVIGQFRDLNNRNRFVWLRGFGDMVSRARALQDFYGGLVWKAHRETANTTMIDSDNVLLLRPASPTSGFDLTDSERPPLNASESAEGFVLATIYYFDAPVSADFVEFFEQTIKPAWSDAGAAVASYFMTEPSKNTFPALPVREGENVFVWFSRFDNTVAYELHLGTLARSERWRDVSNELASRLSRQPEVLKLSPTARSQLR
jgi:hypothetical protein